MASVGEKLRRARLDQGRDLAEVSLRTKINHKFLEAIEADDRQKLPVGCFYRNWVKDYARELSLDVGQITEELDRVTAGDQPLLLPGQELILLPKQSRPAPITINRGGGAHRFSYSVAMLVVVMLSCSGFYAWWRNAQVHASEPAPTVQAAQPAVRPAQPAVQEPAPVPASIVVAEPAAPIDLEIELAATEKTWVSINPDGKSLFSGVMNPEERKTVAAQETARIKVGNAGGLMIRLNGKFIGPIGPEGQVRTVILDRNGHHILEPKPPASESASPNAVE